MPHNGQKWLAQSRKTSFIQIINPAIKMGMHHKLVKADYIEIPRVASYKTWPLMDMLNDRSIRKTITAYNELKESANG